MANRSGIERAQLHWMSETIHMRPWPQLLCHLVVTNTKDAVKQSNQSEVTATQLRRIAADTSAIVTLVQSMSLS
jgi:hypothetical protein